MRRDYRPRVRVPLCNDGPTIQITTAGWRGGGEAQHRATLSPRLRIPWAVSWYLLAAADIIARLRHNDDIMHYQ